MGSTPTARTVNNMMSPTEVVDRAWVIVQTRKSGKWLVYRTEDEIDAAWNTIKEATRRGELGFAAKVSTSLAIMIGTEVGRAEYTDEGVPLWVICVYTRNYDDKEDVMRVREALRDLGFVERLKYKSDAQTRKGEYGEDFVPLYEA